MHAKDERLPHTSTMGNTLLPNSFKIQPAALVLDENPTLLSQVVQDALLPLRRGGNIGVVGSNDFVFPFLGMT
jgi:hypothetical protein